jgi:hypothetical protein
MPCTKNANSKKILGFPMENIFVVVGDNAFQ